MALIKDGGALVRAFAWAAVAGVVLMVFLLGPQYGWKDPEAPREVVISDSSGVNTPLVSWVKTSFSMKDSTQATRHELRLEDEVVVTVVAVPSTDSEKKAGSLAAWLDKVAPTRPPREILNALVPYINGVALKGVYPVSIQTPSGKDAIPAGDRALEVTKLHYRLIRNESNRDAWTILLGRPGTEGAHRPVTFTIGTEQGGTMATAFDTARELRADDTQLQFMSVSSWWKGILAAMALLLIWFLYKAQTSDIVRDTDCDPDEGQLHPYSLSRVQMAVWLFVVVGVYLLIWLITRDRGDLPGSVLILIGLSSATTVGSLLIDANRRSSRRTLEQKIDTLDKRVELLKAQKAANPPDEKKAAIDAELAKLEPELTAATKELAAMPRSKRNSEGFLNDLINDGTGVSLHRLQIVVWTATLAVIFIVGAWRNLAMPVFSDGLLALMGISSGTYLGFKSAE